MGYGTGRATADIGSIVDQLRSAGRLVTVTSPVEPVHELAGVAARLEGGDAAVLFESVRGHDRPVLAGLYWSRGLLAELLGRPVAELPRYVADRVEEWQADPDRYAPRRVDAADAPVRAHTQPETDLRALPVPVHATGDAGPYLDAAPVLATHPDTGIRNLSIQRFWVTGTDTMRINIDAGRHLGVYLRAAHDRGEPLRFSVNIGVGPGLHFAAASPPSAAPIDTDEVGIASVFDGEPVAVCAGDLPGVELLADAQWSLECEIWPGELAPEGPFAEVTGLYALVAERPVVRVRAVHHRPSPVFHTILGGREVWNSVGLLGEAAVCDSVRRAVPDADVQTVVFTHAGGGFYDLVVQVGAKAPEHCGRAVIEAAFAAWPPAKQVTVVDADIDPTDALQVGWSVTQRADASADVLHLADLPGHELNPQFRGGRGNKIGFDATRKGDLRGKLGDRVRYLPVDLDGYTLVRP